MTQLLLVTYCRSVRIAFLRSMLLLSALLCLVPARAANIIIVNQDGPGEGLNDATPAAPIGGNSGTTIGQQRLNVFARAAEFWGARLVSSVPIRVEARFDPLSCTANSGTLGSTGPIELFRDFAGAPVPNTYYPSALANALAGTDLDPAQDDMSATFNSEVGKSGCLSTLHWYYGLDHNPPANSIDFLDTVIHEFAHGFGFLSTVDLSTGAKLNGFDDAFIRDLEDHRTGKLYPAMTDAERVSASTATSNLHWVGTNVLAMKGILTAGVSGGHVQMFAPNQQQPGSSVSHWDTALFPDELMEPYDTPTVDPRLTIESMKDIGWKLTPGVPLIVSNGVSIAAENCGFGNASIDPGETVSVSFSLRNGGTASTSNLMATLLTGSGVSVASAAQSYGTVVAGGAPVSRSFSLSATGLCAGALTANLHLQDGTNDLGTLSFPFKLGSIASFTNNAAISVPASGNGSPYPSTLTISNQTANINGLVVRLLGVTHANPDDLDILLVGPGGQTVLLMSDAGGSADINNVTLTFDDAASSFLPDSTQITSGTFKPTDYTAGDTFPSPAPGGPYGSSLSIFNGTSPNGTWRLFVRDDTSPRSGSIAGWSLSFPACCSDFGPLLTISTGSVTYVENSAPLTIDPAAAVANSAPDFNNGSLFVQVATNATANDHLSIRNDGNGSGQIGLSGNVVTFGGVGFGTFSTNAVTNLTVSFNAANVIAPAVQALVRAIQFVVDSDDPGSALRGVQFSLSNGRAAAPAMGLRFVGVTPINDPPVLSPIANRVIYQGSTLTFTNHATDPDSTALTFGFTNSPPTGVLLNPTTGVFSWTPTPAQTPSTNLIGIKVTDNGSPLLSDSKSFSVIVQRPPLIQSISLAGTNVNIQWTAISNQAYRLQYKTNLSNAAWVTLPGSITASNSSASARDAIRPDLQRFYRIQVVP